MRDLSSPACKKHPIERQYFIMRVIKPSEIKKQGSIRTAWRCKDCMIEWQKAQYSKDREKILRYHRKRKLIKFFLAEEKEERMGM